MEYQPHTMYAIVYGPHPAAPPNHPKGLSAADYESSEAERREQVIANEAGCLMYQLVKTSKGEYYVLEVYKDREALDVHFKNMGAKGAMPLSKIKATSPLQIFPVVGGFLHQGEASLANFISLPIANGAAFEAATVPALAEFDATEPGTLAYMLCKHPDGSSYYFIELFKDEAAVKVHGESAAFKNMAKRQGAAKANDKSRKAKFLVGMTPCTSTSRKTVYASAKASL